MKVVWLVGETVDEAHIRSGRERAREEGRRLGCAGIFLRSGDLERASDIAAMVPQHNFDDVSGVIYRTGT